MNDSQFGPGAGAADDRTRATGPGQQANPAQSGGYPPPTPQQPFPPQGPPVGHQGSPYGQGQQPFQPGPPEPRRQAGYFRSLFDLSYENLGAPKFARVFQVLFMIVSGLGVLVVLMMFLRQGNMVLPVLAIVLLPLVWLLLNTLVRLVLEAVVGIVQTAENSEEMLAILRDRGRA